MLLGILGSFLPVLPGPPVSWAGLLLLVLTKAVPNDWWFIGITGAVALLVFAMDYFIPAMGTKKFDVEKLNIQYAFELENELTDEGFEAYLPEEVQMRLFLPRLTHPLADGRINQMILDYVTSDEESAAAAMRPAIERWRSQQTESTKTGNHN